MKIEIINKKENKLLNRVEVKAKASDFNATPNRKEVIEELAKKLETKIEKIAIKKIGQEYGRKEAVITANVYNSEEELKKTETHVKKVSGNEGEKKEAKV
jgi:ribosomal protein S24E